MRTKNLLRAMVVILIVAVGLLVYFLLNPGILLPSESELVQESFFSIIEQSINDSGINASPEVFKDLFKFPSGFDFSHQAYEQLIDELLISVQDTNLTDEEKTLLIDELSDSFVDLLSDTELYIPTESAEVVKEFPNMTVSPVVSCQHFYDDEALSMVGLELFTEIKSAYLRRCEHESGTSDLYSLLGNNSPSSSLKSEWLYCKDRPDDVRIVGDTTVVFCNTLLSTASAVDNRSLFRLVYDNYTDQTYELMLEFLGIE